MSRRSTKQRWAARGRRAAIKLARLRWAAGVLLAAYRDDCRRANGGGGFVSTGRSETAQPHAMRREMGLPALADGTTLADFLRRKASEMP